MESNRPPHYPETARRRGDQGRVIVRVNVSPDGEPLTLSIAHSSGSTTLDEAAMAAVRQWRFVPARQSGQPVAAAAEVPIVFRLEN
jgi:protein TonB